jgi:hypothetical protein
VGVWIYTFDGVRTSIQDIFYYDLNTARNHAYGLPHWNHERRLIRRDQTEKKTGQGIEYHIIPDSDWLKVSFEGQEKTIAKSDR